MSERYLVSGEQVGNLMSLYVTTEEKNEIFDKIIKEQVLFNSPKPIWEDCKIIMEKRNSISKKSII
jgi:hypothetical protein